MGAYSFHRFKHHLLAVVLSLLFVQAVRAQSYLSVTCTNDGNGLFSFTFSRGTDRYFWEVTGDAVITIKTYGLSQTFQPEGWTSSVDTNGWVTWKHPDGIAYLDQPTTFAILSSYKKPILYNDWGPTADGSFSRGVLVGALVTERGGDSFGGIDSFAFMGPDPNSIRTLSLEIIGTNAVVSWPTELSGYMLQSSTNAATETANWSTVTNEPVIVGTQFCVTNPISAGPVFFRLSK